MMKEPIRHHYIPQFILRNFASGDGTVTYYDKKTKKVSKVKTRDVFMSRNLYRDEINNDTDPVKIEKDLAEFESEVSHILRKFLADREIVLTYEEDEKLKLFFAIMGFRSYNTKKLFNETLTNESRRFYSNWQNDKNFDDFWKRNLGYLVNCRSLSEVFGNPYIDEPIKVFILRDTNGFTGAYFTVAEVTEEKRFIIGDTYPITVYGELDYGLKIPIYYILPFSPRRIILMVFNGADATPRDVLGFRPMLLLPPKNISESQTIKIRVKKLYPEEVEEINRGIEKESKEGFIFNYEFEE